ncbi:MAG: AraC family transcriptional regulator, partial [Verrucomicrobia bacterium]|nr:AraC family transcriptional regulator [Verrucomicrobiota bacterium]
HELELDVRLTSRRRSVQLFLSGLSEHLQEDWTLDKMAYQCGLGATAFSNYCRQITNLTPTRYLVCCRVEAAKKMLSEHPNMSITDIALACGFQNSQYLATVFRQKTGRPPRAWRKDADRGRHPAS